MKNHWQVSKMMVFQKLLTPKQITALSYYYHKLVGKVIEDYEVNNPKVTYKFDLTKTNNFKDILYDSTGLRNDTSDVINLHDSFGNYFKDADGNDILDLSMNHGFNVLGYNPRPIIAKTKLEYFQQNTINDFNETASIEYVSELRELNKLAPLDVENIQICDNESNAIETAVRFATLSYLSQNKVNHNAEFKILTFEGGNYQNNALQIPFPYIQYPYSENQSNNLAEESRSLEGLEKAIKEQRNNGKIIPAIIVEPIQYKAGVRHASPLFYRKIQDICEKENIKFIVDETYTCGWVTGRPFYFSSWCSEKAPDAVVFGGRMQVSGFFHKRNLIDLEMLEGLKFNIRAKPDLFKLNYLNLLKKNVYKKDWIDLHSSDFFSSIFTEFNDIKRKVKFNINKIRGVGKMFAFDVDHKLLRDEIIYMARKRGFKISGLGDTTIVFTPCLLFTEVHFNYFTEFLTQENFATINISRI